MRSRNRRYVALASVAGALIAAVAFGGRPVSSAAASSNSGTVVFSSLDRFAAEVPAGAAVSRPGADTASAPSGGWESAGSLSTPRSRLGLAFFPGNGKFYALGGESTGGNRALPIEEYTPATNTWVTKSMLQTGVANTGAATVGSFIYVPGGFDGVSGLTLTQKYDPVTDTVTTGAPMPVGNFAHGVAALGTKIYVLGGSATGLAGTTNLIYDTVANSWSTGAAVPTAVGYPTAVSDGTYVYLLGGTRPT